MKTFGVFLIFNRINRQATTVTLKTVSYIGRRVIRFMEKPIIEMINDLMSTHLSPMFNSLKPLENVRKPRFC